MKFTGPGPSATLASLARVTGAYGNPQYPLVMSLTDVVADAPDGISVLSSDANLTLDGVNLPIWPSSDERVQVRGPRPEASIRSGRSTAAALSSTSRPPPAPPA